MTTRYFSCLVLAFPNVIIQGNFHYPNIKPHGITMIQQQDTTICPPNWLDIKHSVQLHAPSRACHCTAPVPLGTSILTPMLNHWIQVPRTCLPGSNRCLPVSLETLSQTLQSGRHSDCLSTHIRNAQNINIYRWQHHCSHSNIISCY